MWIWKKPPRIAVAALFFLPGLRIGGHLLACAVCDSVNFSHALVHDVDATSALGRVTTRDRANPLTVQDVALYAGGDPWLQGPAVIFHNPVICFHGALMTPPQACFELFFGNLCSVCFRLQGLLLVYLFFFPLKSGVPFASDRGSYYYATTFSFCKGASLHHRKNRIPRNKELGSTS